MSLLSLGANISHRNIWRYWLRGEQVIAVLFRVVVAIAVAVFLFPFRSHAQTMILHDGMPPLRMGLGINQVTTESTYPCVASTLEGPTVLTKDGPQTTGGLTRNHKIKEIRSATDARETLEMGAYAQFFGYGAKLKANSLDVLSKHSHSEKVHFLMRVTASGLLRALVSPKPSDDALALLKADPTGRLFAKACGDAIITEVEYGAALFIVLTFQTSSVEVKNEIHRALDLAWGKQEVGVALLKRVTQFSQNLEFEIDVTQIGLGGTSVPAFKNIPALMEYGRTFAENLKASDAKPLRVHYRKYDVITSFVLAQDAAKAGVLQFSNSIDVMKGLVDAYHRARDNQRLVAHALSAPDDFEGEDVPPKGRKILEDYQKKIGQQAEHFASKARECAAAASAGGVCAANPNLDVEELPRIRRIPLCTLTEADLTNNDGCKSRMLVDKKCVCVHCRFLSQTTNFPNGVSQDRTCVGMPANTSARITYEGRVKLPGPGMKHGYGALKFGSNPTVQYQSMPNPMTFFGEEKTIVSPSGDVTAKLHVEACQPTPCEFEPEPGRSHIIEIRTGR
jgi:hypothetical protein